MILETVDLTPEEASKLLAVSAHYEQRPLRRSNVERLTYAIESGQWQETHQPIALNRDGVVIDGQHRLTAIVAANRTVRVVIARDVPDESFSVIDTGAVRSPSDVLRLAGFHDTARLGASLRFLLVYDSIVGTTDSIQTHRNKITSADILRLAKSDRGRELESSMKAAVGVTQVMGRSGFATWMGAVIQIMRESPVDDGLCLEFIERLRDGANLKPGSPILTMRRYLTSEGGLIKVTGGERPQIGMGSTIKAFNAWLEGADRHLFSFRIGLERMPAVVPVVPHPAPTYIP
jgi:hypothetical protein